MSSALSCHSTSFFYSSTRLVIFSNTPVQGLELAGFYDFTVRLITKLSIQNTPVCVNLEILT